jgi:hypothetical protein
MLYDPDPNFIRQLTGGDIARRGSLAEEKLLPHLEEKYLP